MRANPDYSSGTQRGPDMAARWDALQLRLSELGGLARPDARTLALFARQLALVLSAGLHLCPALEALAVQARSALMRAVLREAVLSISCGCTLWSVMERHPGVFPPYFRALTRTGEESGSLGAALRKLARDCERELELSSRIHPVLNYSALLLCIASGITALMLLFLVPMYAAFYSDFSGGEAQLPAPTRLLFHISELLVRHWWVLPLLPVFYMICGRLRRSAAGRRLLDPLVLFVPLFGPLARKVHVERFARTLGLLTGAGLPLPAALEICAESAGNSLFRRAIAATQRRVCRGMSVSDALRPLRTFPRTAKAMLAGSEAAGSLDKSLQQLADYYDREVQTSMLTLLGLAEPGLLAVIGLTVGWMVFALYLPIFNLTGTIR